MHYDVMSQDRDQTEFWIEVELCFEPGDFEFAVSENLGEKI